MSHKSKRVLLWMILCTIMIAVLVPVASSQSSQSMLKMVFIEVDSTVDVKKLVRMGIDVAAVRTMESGTTRVEAVISADDEKKLDRMGYQWSLPADAELSMALRADGVYHSFEEPILGIKDQLYQIATRYPAIVHLEVIGNSIQNRPLIALRLTSQGGKSWHERPEVLILATHHAREWVATEMAMRLIKYLTENYGVNDRVTRLLDTTQVWIVPMANPDGYQYTFDQERLWRKNLRDNDNDGQITVADGVDLNRNFASRWGLDDEGSSPIWSNSTYRGVAPNSEPETQAVVTFIQKHKFKYLISYHTYGNLILYPLGWQVKTKSFDDPIFVAQAGTDENPAIWDSLLNQGYNPGVGADLYITNGDFTEWTYSEEKIPSYVVELTQGVDADGNFYGFEFPDDEAMVQTVFEDNLEFALSLMESAQRPWSPVSPVGITVENIYHTPVTVSYGKSQGIEILARNGRPPIILYQVNDKGWQFARFRPMLGAFYNDEPGAYFSRYRAEIKGQHAGDTITYRIISWHTILGPYTYTVKGVSENSILLVSAEDYTGDRPVYIDPSAPNYLDYYTAALDASGYTYDIWDVTAKGAVPTVSETLAHYDVVIWYTGDDYTPTVPHPIVHENMVLNIREFINYHGGKLFATGQDLSYLSTVEGEFSDDFFQYYLGAIMHVEEGGMSLETALPFDVKGEANDPIFDGLSFAIFGGTGASNQLFADSFLVTSHFLPHFDSVIAATYDRPGGPFDPHSGEYYVYSQMADSAYKRLGGIFLLPDGNPELKFWISFDIEADWDYAFVEIRESGTDNWTTLADINGWTTQDTGYSCANGWVERIHPQLAHYMDNACNPTGTTGEWHAFTERSSGWRQVVMDLTPWAGRTVELFITYASDWGVQNLGVFVDDIELSGQPLENFETGLGHWQVTSTKGNTPFNNWIRMTGAGFPEGPAIRTPNGVYLGFGFEAIDTEQNRAEVMGRVMKYLLDKP